MEKMKICQPILTVLCVGLFGGAALAQSVVAPGQPTAVTSAPAPVAQPVKPQPVLSQAPKATDEWTFCQIGFWPNVPKATATSNAYGIKSGWPACGGSGRVHGVEAAWIVAGTDHVKGVQCCWVTCIAKEIDGVQASLGYTQNTEHVNGLQASFVNVGGDLLGFQPGAVNVAKNVTGMQMGVFADYCNDIDGLQIGLVNASDRLTGFQLAGINTATECNGFQFGIINASKKSGFQIGLMNYIKDSPFPLMPLINFKF